MTLEVGGLSRQGRIAVEGSPSFAFDNALIAASGVWVVNLESNTTYGNQINKYLPLDFLELVNNQAEDVIVRINDVEDYRVLGNTSRRVTERPIRQVRITNTSAVNAIAATTMRLTLERLPANADSEARHSARGRVR